MRYRRADRQQTFPRWCRHRLRHKVRSTRSGGFTLVEMLVAMTITLIMIFALAQVFTVVGNTIAEGRASMEMSGSLRSVASRLQRDLDGITCPVRPWAEAGAGHGYFEYFEGVGNDMNPLPLSAVSSSVSNSFGDIDDVLAFTARSEGSPFKGFHRGDPIVSYEAEIIWFTRFEDRDGDGLPGPGEVFLYRRVLLIVPNHPYNLNANVVAPYDLSDYLDHYQNSDISARSTTNGIVANTLSDLTNRQNRFAHRPDLFPHLISRAMLIPRGTVFAGGSLPGEDGVDDNHDGIVDDQGLPFAWETGAFGSNDLVSTDLNVVTHGYGHDLIAPQLLAFDVKAFDPYAEIHTTGNNIAVVPGDPGWPVAGVIGNQVPTGRGAFVDLGYRNFGGNIVDGLVINHSSRRPAATDISTGRSLFSGLPAFRDRPNTGIVGVWDPYEPFLGVYNIPVPTPGNSSPPPQPILGTSYCTWSTYYEHDGIDQNGNGLIDEGNNGLDDDPDGPGPLTPNGIVDDAVERETSPPYPFPLRGIQVRIRLIEPGTRQVRQMTVVADFIPE